MHNTPFNIVDLFYKAADKNPDNIAIIYRDEKTDFGTFAKSVTETATYFSHKGIQKGDRVMVFVPMSDGLYRIVLALFKIGAVAVFLDEWVSIKRLNDCCKLADCKAFIGTTKGRLLAWLVPGLRRIPLHLSLSYRNDLPATPFPNTCKEDIALITFTTGSTGTPKAAIRTHELLNEQFRALIPVIRPTEKDICMPVLPIVLLLNLGAGVTSVIADYKGSKPASLNPSKIVSQIKAHSVNVIIASPFFVKEISRYLVNAQIGLPAMKKIFTGGAPVFPTEAMIYQNAFPDSEIQIVYGSTEAEPISSIDAKTLTREVQRHFLQGLKVGKPEAAAEVKIIRIADAVQVKSEKELNDLVVEPGETGEIIISGKHVLRTYLHNPEALKRSKIFVGDVCWHRTGDSGYWADEGNLFLTGRCNTLIIRKGKTIAPFMYENKFQNIRGVECGTVLLINDKLLALLELNDQSLKAVVTEAVRQSPDTFDEIIFIKKIPRDPRHNSKIDYEKLTRSATKSI